MAASIPVLGRLLQDPPPELVFEIASDTVRMARWGQPESLSSVVLPAGVIQPSPLHENVLDSVALAGAVRELAPAAIRGKRRSAAVLLPDHSAHVAVLDFAKLPDKREEQLSIIRFRLKRSVPFDVDQAALSYWVQNAPGAKGKREVVAAVTAAEIVNRFETPFRALGIHPGLVTLAPLAAIDLLDNAGLVVMARLSGAILTIAIKQSGVLKLFRSLELAAPSLDEIAGHLHPTFAFAEDNFGGLPEGLYLAGFGDLAPEALGLFPAELGVPVSILGGADTAIRGYLKGALA